MGMEWMILGALRRVLWGLIFVGLRIVVNLCDEWKG